MSTINNKRIPTSEFSEAGNVNESATGNTAESMLESITSMDNDSQTLEQEDSMNEPKPNLVRGVY